MITIEILAESFVKLYKLRNVCIKINMFGFLLDLIDRKYLFLGKIHFEPINTDKTP